LSAASNQALADTDSVARRLLVLSASDEDRMEQDQVATIVRALAVYLRANPHACDTISGIARWWVDPGMRVSTAALQDALAWLTRFGALEVVATGDGRKRYRRVGDDSLLDAAAGAANGKSNRSTH
jgi:hypothetical protein